MKLEEIFRNYFQGLERGDARVIVDLFAPDGTVTSPLYGTLRADEFYTGLFKDTLESRLTLKNIFQGRDNPLAAAVHFLYEWKLKDGTPTSFECVDVLEFDQETWKIKHLTIIYDTAETRFAFERGRKADS